MPDPILQPPQDNSATEALIVSHEKAAAQQGAALEALVHQGEKNNPVPALEASIVQTEKLRGTVDEKGTGIAEAISKLAPEVQKMHGIMELVQTFMQSIKGDKGDQGEKGDNGEKGDQGVQGEIGPEGAQGPAGEQGIQGVNGDKGEQGARGDQGEPGIAGPVGPQGAKGDKGDPAHAEPLEELAAKLVEHISYEKIKDRPNLDTFRKPAARDYNVSELKDVSMQNIVSGQILQWDGTRFIPYTLTSGGTQVFGEVIGSAGSASFTLAHTPTANTVRIYRGGAYQQVGVGKDYTISGAVGTLASVLDAGGLEVLLADYNY